MKKGNVTIGKFCKDMKIQPSKLRYYESLGLIQPAEIDEENGYHYYSYTQYAEIEIIQTCRKLNFPLKKIKKIQENQESQELLELIAKQREQAKKALLEQQEVFYDLSWLYDALKMDMILCAEPNQMFQLANFPERKVLMVQPTPEEAALPSDMLNASLQYQLSKYIAAEAEENSSVRKRYGYRLNCDDFQKKELTLSGKFAELPQYTARNKAVLYTIPAGTYLALPAQAFVQTTWIHQILTYTQEHRFRIRDIFLTEIAPHLIPRQDAFYHVQVLITSSES